MVYWKASKLLEVVRARAERKKAGHCKVTMGGKKGGGEGDIWFWPRILVLKICLVLICTFECFWSQVVSKWMVLLYLGIFQWFYIN